MIDPERNGLVKNIHNNQIWLLRRFTDTIVFQYSIVLKKKQEINKDVKTKGVFMGGGGVLGFTIHPRNFFLEL